MALKAASRGGPRAPLPLALCPSGCQHGAYALCKQLTQRTLHLRGSILAGYEGCEQGEEVLEVGPEGVRAEGQQRAQRGHSKRRQRAVLLAVHSGARGCHALACGGRQGGEGGMCVGGVRAR